MKVLHVSTYDRGGAAIACLRLHQALLQRGVDSQVLVRQAAKSYPGVSEFRVTRGAFESKINGLLYRLRFRKHPVKSKNQLLQEAFKNSLPPGIEFFSFPDAPTDVTKTPLFNEADIIHLHWVSGFLNYETFFDKVSKPIVWTLHDMEPFQGGIHYEEKSFGVTSSGMPKPFSIPPEIERVIKRNLEIKRVALSRIKNLTIVAPSLWLKNKSQQSSLLGRFSHHHLPYGLDSEIFKPRDKLFSKNIFNIPVDKPCLLFVSDKVETYRKGFEFLKQALQQIDSNRVTLCAIGTTERSDLGANIQFIGRIEDVRLMSVAYSAADVFIIPSLEDNLPNTVLEALMCGTPVIGFPTGGIPDMITDGLNGVLCEDISVNSLAQAIEKCLSCLKVFNSAKISQFARERYDQTVQADGYIELYRSLT